MITVILKRDSLTVEGHANYAEKGKDIVCAAVSALTLATFGGLQHHAGMFVMYSVDDGRAYAWWRDKTKTGEVLIRTYIDAIKQIAEDYGRIEVYEE